MAALAQAPLPDVGALVVQGAAAFARAHPIKLSLNVVGLLLLFCASGYAPSPAAEARFEASLPSAQAVASERALGRAAAEARAAFDATRGWFWSCTGDCVAARAASQAADARWAVARDDNERSQAKAKGELGIFSRYGVDDARDQFWRSFNGGAAYAKRATMWDALFVGMRTMGRDEPFLSFLLNMVLRFLMNLTVGIGIGVLHFYAAVVYIIRSYNANFLTGLCFFACAFVVGASFFFSAVASLFAGAALAATGGMSLLRIAAQQQGPPPRMRAHEE